MNTRKTKIFGAIALLTIATVGYYFSLTSNTAKSSKPPAITISYSKYQGYLSGDIVCKIPALKEKVAKDADVSAFKAPADKASATLSAGIHLYHSDTDMTAQAIISAIEPKVGNSVLIGYLPHGKDIFDVTPALAGQNVMTDLTKYTIPANEGFVIFSCVDTKIYGVKDEKTLGAALPAILTDAALAGKTTGWILTAAKDVSLTASLSANDPKNKISETWVQNGPDFDFGDKLVANDSNIQANSYKMIFLNVAPAGAVNPPPSGTATVIVTPSTELVDTKVGDVDTLAYLTFTSDQIETLSSIQLKVKGGGNLANLTNFTLESSNTLDQVPPYDLANPKPVTATITAANGLIDITFKAKSDPAKVQVSPLSPNLYLRLKATIGPAAAVGDKYQIGIDDVSGIKFYENIALSYSGGTTPPPSYFKQYKVVDAVGAASSQLPAPANFQVDSSSSAPTSEKFTWSPPPGIDVSKFSNYHFKYGLASDTKTAIGDLYIKLSDGTSVIAKDLLPGTDYWATIAAATLVGQQYTDGVEAPTTFTTQFPKVASFLVDKATATSSSVSVKLVWTPPAGVDPAKIFIYRLRAGLNSGGPAIFDKDLTIGNTTYTINDLTPSTSYWFSIDAQYNNIDGLQSLIDPYITPDKPVADNIPSAPSDIIFNNYLTSVEIGWKQPVGDISLDTGKYNLIYEEGACPGDVLNSTTVPFDAGAALTNPGFNTYIGDWTVEGLESGKLYHFYLLASNDGINFSPDFNALAKDAADNTNIYCHEFTTKATI